MLRLGLTITSSTCINSLVGCVWLSAVCVDILPHHSDHATPFKLGLKRACTAHFRLHWGGLQRNKFWKLKKWLHIFYPLVALRKLKGTARCGGQVLSVSHFPDFENGIFLIQMTRSGGLVVSLHLVGHIHVLKDSSACALLLTMAWTVLWDHNDEQIQRKLLADPLTFAMSPSRTSWHSVRSSLSRYSEHINGCIVELDCLLPTDCTVWLQKGVVAPVGSVCLSSAVRMEYKRMWPMAHHALTAQLCWWYCALRGRHTSAVLMNRKKTWQFASLSWARPTRDDENNLTYICEFPRVCNTSSCGGLLPSAVDFFGSLGKKIGF